MGVSGVSHPKYGVLTLGGGRVVRIRSAAEGRLGIDGLVRLGGIRNGSVPYPIRVNVPGPRIVELAAGGWSVDMPLLPFPSSFKYLGHSMLLTLKDPFTYGVINYSNRTRFTTLTYFF